MARTRIIVPPDSGAYSRNPQSSKSGFTLVEVVLAMVLLSAGTLGLVHLAGAALLTSRSGMSATSVGVYAENALEATRDRGFAGTAPGVTTDTLQVRGVRYARTVTIVDRNGRLREIRVDVLRVPGGDLAYTALAYLVR